MTFFEDIGRQYRRIGYGHVRRREINEAKKADREETLSNSLGVLRLTEELRQTLREESLPSLLQIPLSDQEKSNAIDSYLENYHFAEYTDLQDTHAISLKTPNSFTDAQCNALFNELGLPQPYIIYTPGSNEPSYLILRDSSAVNQLRLALNPRDLPERSR